jgi:hypothetical protein
MTYLLKENEVKRVWPSTSPLAEFYDSGAAAMNIKFIVDDYFDRIPGVFDKVKKNIEELASAASRTFGDLLDVMRDYNNSMVIGGDFVR